MTKQTVTKGGKSAKVYFHGYIAPSSNTVNVAEVEGNTVGECLKGFVKHYPRAKEILFDNTDKIYEHFWIVLNNHSISPEELKEPVHNGDEIHIMMTICGG